MPYFQADEGNVAWMGYDGLYSYDGTTATPLGNPTPSFQYANRPTIPNREAVSQRHTTSCRNGNTACQRMNEYDWDWQ